MLEPVKPVLQAQNLYKAFGDTRYCEESASRSIRGHSSVS